VQLSISKVDDVFKGGNAARMKKYISEKKNYKKRLKSRKFNQENF